MQYLTTFIGFFSYIHTYQKQKFQINAILCFEFKFGKSGADLRGFQGSLSRIPLSSTESA